MNRLVKDLLQLSRLDYKQEKWNKKESNLISLLIMTIDQPKLAAWRGIAGIPALDHAGLSINGRKF